MLASPPSQQLMKSWYLKYLRSGLKEKLDFSMFLQAHTFTNHSRGMDGMDDGMTFSRSKKGMVAGSPQNLFLTSTSSLHLLVLCVDFPDRQGHRNIDDYRSLFFSMNEYPGGSVLEYFQEVSNGAVQQITGTVHGWLRMPHKLPYYTNGSSGLNADTPERNSQKLAEDAIDAALDAGIEFSEAMDLFGNKYADGLVIIHAGQPAESSHSDQVNDELWSVQWYVHNSIEVADNLYSNRFMLISQGAEIGVSAHELGHLAFAWDDFYDFNFEDGSNWQGTGAWDLMGSGCNNNGGYTPAHPIALHKIQYGWINTTEIATSQKGIELQPAAGSDAEAIIIRSSAYRGERYLLLENRQRIGYDQALPGTGLLVWRIDPDGNQATFATARASLIQADGKRDMDYYFNFNAGDPGDPFPGSVNRRTLPASGRVNTRFPGGNASDVAIRNIRELQSGVLRFDIVIG